MKKILNELYNHYKNMYAYRYHTKTVHEFIKNKYPSEKTQLCWGPIFDNDCNIDREDEETVYYLVSFKKDFPENSLTLKINKKTKEITESNNAKFKKYNRVGPGLSPEPPTAPGMRVRTGRFTLDSETPPIDL
jgi:hypothetical protein